MSRIPSRFEDGVYNKENLNEYHKGFIDSIDLLIKEDLDEYTYNILDIKYHEKSVINDLVKEIIIDFVGKLKEWLNMEADEFNCIFIEEEYE